LNEEFQVESHGPFSNLAELKTHPAHLAVFINYLLSIDSPNSLFFYVITDAFQSAQGSPKDFRRWAFEIFTTFVIPNSPLVIPNSDQNIIQPIDKAYI
ncbi:regulator of G protein signaling-like domain protein, partial [Oesophagostomum dentatum]